jgi:capsular polysaccharide export protein
LLLQGPVGPFFFKLAQFLKGRGTRTHKINFNPGDEWFYSTKEAYTFLYDFTIDYWPEYLERFIGQNQIEAIFLFGDCRPIHAPAKALCQQYGIDLWVFEEGYYRPNYFTLEYFGVNANSSLYKTSLQSLLVTDVAVDSNKPIKKPISFDKTHLHMTRYAVIYWLSNVIQPFKCANYDHHRQLNFLIAYRWIKNYFTRWLYKIKDYPKLKELADHKFQNKKNYFLLPLQVHDDSQMTHHSHFDSIEQVIETVLTSFYKHQILNKNLETKLIIKHHPMDRGHKNYSTIIKTLSKNLKISKHVYYIHELDLNMFLPNCKGCVTVNSTLGLKALDMDVPVKNLGLSFYDKPHITSQKSLDQFWSQPGPVCPKNILAFKRLIIKKTQVNGCMYSPEYQIK